MKRSVGNQSRSLLDNTLPKNLKINPDKEDVLKVRYDANGKPIKRSVIGKWEQYHDKKTFLDTRVNIGA